MIIGVNIGVQKVDSNAYDNLQTEEILYYLNKAQREYIRRQAIYLKENMEGNRPDFISDSEAGNNLGNLLVNDAIGSANLSSYSVYQNGVSAATSNLSESLFSFVSGLAKVAGETKYLNIKEISHSEIKGVAQTSYNYPVFRDCAYLQIGTDLVFFHSSLIAGLDDVNFMYVKEPSKLVKESPGAGEVATSELASHTHDDIVDLTVSMILEDLKSAKPYSRNQEPIQGKELK